MVHGLGLLRSVWDLPGPGIEPMSPAWAGGFFTIEPLGSPNKPGLTGIIIGRLN